jgi:hypothetical protein
MKVEAEGAPASPSVFAGRALLPGIVNLPDC